MRMVGHHYSLKPSTTTKCCAEISAISLPLTGVEEGSRWMGRLKSYRIQIEIQMRRNIQPNIIEQNQRLNWVSHNNTVVATKRNRLVTSKHKELNMEAEGRVRIHEILPIPEVIEDEPTKWLIN